jgi:MoxR-like ATPase
VSLHPVAVQLNAIREEMSSVFFERRRVIDGCILGLLTNEHVFVLGHPGTGKTALGKDLFRRIRNKEFFSVSLSKSKPAEAVLGPLDIPGLRDRGEMVRKIKGYLPTADYALVDEVGKMAPTLGHDMLNVLLDREMDQVDGGTGRSTIDVPLRMAYSGSNELPTEESENAAALWDRILIRLTVESLQESSNVAAMLAGTIHIANPVSVEFADLADVADNVVPLITIPTDVIEAMLQLREMLRGAGMKVSDRRLNQAKKLLQANAFLAGRTEANVDDVQVLRHALWDTPSQIQIVERLTMQVSNPIAAEALEMLDKAEEIATEIRDSKGLSAAKKGELTTQLNGRLKVITSELERIRSAAVATGSSVVKLDEVADRVAAISDGMWRDLMGFDPTPARNRSARVVSV